MKRRIVVAVALCCAVTAAPVAHADPVVPEVGSPCADGAADALTQLPDGETFLECKGVAGGHSWQPFIGPYPSSDRWLSYGPGLTLHGQGRRNPEILSGAWVATPQDASSACSAEQAAVDAGRVAPPQTTTGEAGQPLDFEVVPVVANITLTGNCLWERVS